MVCSDKKVNVVQRRGSLTNMIAQPLGIRSSVFKVGKHDVVSVKERKDAVSGWGVIPDKVRQRKCLLSIYATPVVRVVVIWLGAP